MPRPVESLPSFFLAGLAALTLGVGCGGTAVGRAASDAGQNGAGVAATPTGPSPAANDGGAGLTDAGTSLASACPLPAYPDGSCTGVPAGTTLRNVPADVTSGPGWDWVSGDDYINVTADDAVLDGLNVSGCVVIQADHVTLRRSKVSCTGFAPIYNDHHAGLLVEDTEVDCQETPGSSGVSQVGFTVLRSNIHGCENGFDVDGQVTVQDSYIHDLYASEESHTDGAQVSPGAQDVSFIHDTLLAGHDGNSSIITAAIAKGGSTNLLIEDNLMAGGGYTLYCPEDGKANNFRVIDNHFSTRFYPKVGAFAPTTGCEDEAAYHGNVIDETGVPLPDQGTNFSGAGGTSPR